MTTTVAGMVSIVLAVYLNAANDDGGGVRETMNNIADSHDQIILALIAIVATSIAALVFVIRNSSNIKVAATQATAANKAVNNVGPGEHTLYDMVTAIKEDVAELKTETRDIRAEQKMFAAHGWETLPADMNSAVALTQTIRDLQNGHHAVHEKLDSIADELRSQRQNR